MCGLRGSVADEILTFGVPGLTVNVRDDAVRGSLVGLNTSNPPVVAVVTLWTRQSYGSQVRDTSRCWRRNAQAPQRIW